MRKKLIGIASIIIVLALMLASYKNGSNLKTGQDKKIKNAKTFEESIRSNTLQIDIPNNLRQYMSGAVEARNTIGQFIEIYKEKTDGSVILKIGQYIDNRADPLGLYEESEIEKEYIVSDNEYINYFRYRKGYVEYPSCTIINWSNSATAYGLMIEKDLSESDILELLEITNDQLEIKEETESITQNNWDNYRISNNYYISLPTTDNIEVIDTEFNSTIFLNDKLILVVYYDTEYLDDSFNTDYSSEITNEDNSIHIRYRTDNPFKEGESSYDTYETIKENIQSILESIHSIEKNPKQ